MEESSVEPEEDCGIMIALYAIQTDIIGLLRCVEIIPAKPRLEK